ncbi:hypothetical protein [Nonomuraea sp. NPDC002799]
MIQANGVTLTLGRRLGQGGQGTVHEILDHKINGQWDVAYKAYDPDVLSRLDLAALTAMTGLIGRLPGWDAAWLCDKTAWPAELVEQDGVVTGFLMRSVPYGFSFDLRTLSGSERKLATWEFLLNDDAYVGGIGLRISERDRLLLLADLADTLTRLHTMDIIVGDLSPKNLLFSTEASPACFLIDCDAMRLAGAEALPQVETPDWQIPADEQKGTPQSDAYKFALLVIRVFARDQTSTHLGPLAAVSTALADLATAALQRPPLERPLPGQWAVQLRQAALTAATMPTMPAAPTAVLPPPFPPAPPFASGSPPHPRPGLTPATKIGLGIGAGVLGLVLAVALVVATVAVLSVDPAAESSYLSSSGTPSAFTEPSTTYSPDPWPSASTEPSPSPSEEPTEDPFSTADLDAQSTDPTPITTGALLADSFTSAKGVRYNLKAGSSGKCPDSYHNSSVRSALRKAHCSKMIKGVYVNPHAAANRRIMVSVWVVPLKNDSRADTLYGRTSDAYAEAWGIVCPKKGAGSGLCHSSSWLRARLYGWTGSTHRYVIHTMAIYTNRSNGSSTVPWLKDASKAAYHAVGPMVYHDGD